MRDMHYDFKRFSRVQCPISPLAFYVKIVIPIPSRMCVSALQYVFRNNNLILSIANCTTAARRSRFYRSYGRLISNNWKLKADRVCARAKSVWTATAISPKISFLGNLDVARACVRSILPSWPILSTYWVIWDYSIFMRLDAPHPMHFLLCS